MPAPKTALLELAPLSDKADRTKTEATSILLTSDALLEYVHELTEMSLVLVGVSSVDWLATVPRICWASSFVKISQALTALNFDVDFGVG
jgi:hypothetical protein